MALGRDLTIDGPLTRGLMLNLQEYQAAWARWMPDRFHPIDIQARELVADEAFRPERRFVVPFSGGLDSMLYGLVSARARNARCTGADPGPRHLDHAK